MPPIVTHLMNKINNDFCENKDLKAVSCLINKLSGSTSSIAEHSDDEATIAPDSDIYTIALGDPCTIKYKERATGNVFEHYCEDRSLYVMSRRSQEFFTHTILPGQINGVRYSLTFRCVNWRHRNSTIVLGDSNTGELKFGDSKGTFGRATPGKKSWAPIIDDIKPMETIGYSNIVTMCGINDIRHSHISSKSDVHKVYSSFRVKIEQICHVNPKAKVFVCPLLPTRLVQVNRKVSYFNSLLFNDLLSTNFSVSIVPGFRDFADQLGLLADKHCRRQGDALHLNRYGVHILGSKIKTAIFDRKKRPAGAMTSGRPYSGTVQEGRATHPP